MKDKIELFKKYQNLKNENNIKYILQEEFELFGFQKMRKFVLNDSKDSNRSIWNQSLFEINPFRECREWCILYEHPDYVIYIYYVPELKIACGIHNGDILFYGKFDEIKEILISINKYLKIESKIKVDGIFKDKQ